LILIAVEGKTRSELGWHGAQKWSRARYHAFVAEGAHWTHQARHGQRIPKGSKPRIGEQVRPGGGYHGKYIINTAKYPSNNRRTPGSSGRTCVLASGCNSFARECSRYSGFTFLLRSACLFDHDSSSLFTQFYTSTRRRMLNLLRKPAQYALSCSSLEAFSYSWMTLTPVVCTESPPRSRTGSMASQT